MFRIILTAVIFYFVYRFLDRMLNPARRRSRMKQTPDSKTSGAQKYENAIDADFEEINDK